MDDPQQLIQRIRQEVLPLFENALYDDSVTYDNPHLINCRHELTCDRQGCPFFHHESGNRCWQEVGTYCGGQIQGTFVEKFGNCKECPVFHKSMPTIVEELGEHFNNLMFIIRQQSRLLRSSVVHLKDLNERLSNTFAGLNVENAELEKIANIDPLTGLYNRNRLGNVLESEITHYQKTSHPWSLAILDIDNFKSLNDQYGHLEGDKVLTGLAEIIRKNIRGTDFAFRYGGEEFLLILPRTKRASATAVMERIRREFELSQFITPQGPVSRTISIGVGEIATFITDKEAILRNVDECLYQAKKTGKNRVVSIVVQKKAGDSPSSDHQDPS